MHFSSRKRSCDLSTMRPIRSLLGSRSSAAAPADGGAAAPLLGNEPSSAAAPADGGAAAPADGGGTVEPSPSAGGASPGDVQLRVIEGHVGSQNGVVMGRPVGADAESASTGAAPSAGPEPAPASLTTVVGQVVGAGVQGPSPAQGPNKLVACGTCFANNEVPTGTASLRCGSCGATLRCTDEPALNLQCYACGVCNLVSPGTTRIHCGRCRTLQHVPGASADAQRALQEQHPKGNGGKKV